jgi:hypothetical protein
MVTLKRGMKKLAAETSSKEKKLRLQEQNMINSGKELHVNTYQNIIVQGEGLYTYMSQLPVSAAAGNSGDKAISQEWT